MSVCYENVKLSSCIAAQHFSWSFLTAGTVSCCLLSRQLQQDFADSLAVAAVV